VHLHLAEDRSPALSIGAGGTITQQIEEDANDPRIWDTANGKILSIHLLNSTEFEKITGLLPPRTTVTAETYAESGLPFYQLYTERPSRIGADLSFSAIKTLSQTDAWRECQPSFYYDTQNPPKCKICGTQLADCLYVHLPSSLFLFLRVCSLAVLGYETIVLKM